MPFEEAGRSKHVKAHKQNARRRYLCPMFTENTVNKATKSKQKSLFTCINLQEASNNGTRRRSMCHSGANITSERAIEGRFSESLKMEIITTETQMLSRRKKKTLILSLEGIIEEQNMIKRVGEFAQMVKL